MGQLDSMQFYQPSASEPPKSFGGAEFALEVALERLQSEAAQIVAAAARPRFGGEG